MISQVVALYELFWTFITLELLIVSVIPHVHLERLLMEIPFVCHKYENN